MHIILGVLGTVVTILVLLNKLQENGIDVGWLNPFSWARRRKFRKEYELSAAYTLDNPMDVAALFILGIAKTEGDISKEQKSRILALFTSEFKLSELKSQELLTASAHILGRGDDLFDSTARVLHRSKDQFNAEQIKSVLYMMNEVAIVEGDPNSRQLKLIKAFEDSFPKALDKWQK